LQLFQRHYHLIGNDLIAKLSEMNVTPDEKPFIPTIGLAKRSKPWKSIDDAATSEFTTRIGGEFLPIKNPARMM
jgi:hypothetical protein